jgi:GTP-binding nuclear protein Ran
MDTIPSYKVCIVGDGNTGKTSFTMHHMGVRVTKYIPTLGVEVHSLIVNTNYGQKRLNIWDCAGQERFGGLKDGYYIQADGAFVFSSNTQPLEEYIRWGNDLKRMVPQIAILRIRSKSDNEETFHNTVSISRERPGSMHMPIMLMLRKLTGKADLVLT